LLLSRIKTYNLHQLATYEPKYLAGLQAQAYDVPLEPAWEAARHRMREETRRACRDQASSSKVRNFSMTLDFTDESWRYVLLPVYLTTYRYEDQPYQVMINGQTGVVAGQRPVDWLKIWFVVAALLLPGLALGVAGLVSLALAGLGLLVGIAGFGLLLVGIILSFLLIRKAQQLDDV
jgi:hypothetical protein